jgi:hypothetical protein
MKSLRLYNKVQMHIFSISNQIAFWLILPIISAISAELLIPNDGFGFIDQTQQNSLIVKVRSLVILFSVFVIIFVGLNNLKNLFLGLYSFNKVSGRPEEMRYKSVLFGYLFMTGLIIFFLNSLNMFGLYCSVILVLIQFVYMLVLLKINPYKQSLTIHKVSLIYGNVLFFLYLIVINLINYVKELDSIVVLLLGYMITGGCAI